MDTRINRTLKKTFGFGSFRPHQKEIVEAILAGQDLFAALPTGGGKSLCYQLPSLLLPHLTVVVSPLIALMEDQVTAARETGLAAAYLNSSLDESEARRVFRAIRSGEVTLLYASPERLAIPSFRATLAEIGVSLFAIDEAHCISEWGHEFRPEYRRLPVLRSEFPATPIAAFTATATPRVQEDVVSLLALQDPLLVRGDFDRREIFYRVRRKTDVQKQILAFVLEHPGEPGIVYRSTRKAVEETATKLENAGIAARPYHAGMNGETRRANQRAFVGDEVQVVVATIAFGMGIDKSNVRWVVHGDLPRSVEAYYQETGRAGRDGEDADTCLFYGPRDIHTIRYHIDRMEVETEREQAQKNLTDTLRFVDSGVCRRVQLLAHFGQTHEGNCGRCDVCTGEIDTTDHSVAAQKVLSAIVRTDERFGRHHIVDVVTGNSTDKVLQFGHQHLPTYGVGADEPRQWWLDLTADLEAAGLLERRDGRKSGLRLTAQGWAVLGGKKGFSSAKRTTRRSGIQASPERALQSTRGTRDEDGPPVVWREDQEALFQCLRAMRKRLARATSVPPYVIASDRVLKAIVRNRPEDRPALLRISGIGEQKAQRYGEEILRTVREFLASGECR